MLEQYRDSVPYRAIFRDAAGQEVEQPITAVGFAGHRTPAAFGQAKPCIGRALDDG